jgi:hypothetical protein
MRLPTRLVPLGAAVVTAALISAVLANDAQAPSTAATAPIPNGATSTQPTPTPQAAAPVAATPAPQAAATAAPSPPPPAAATPAAKLSQQQLDQLLAPIALYPDQLLGQILMASTYPAEVVEAARWVRLPAHRGLKGEALAAALKPKGWDPSVMALVPFPRVLEMMSERLDWLRDLGTVFVAQQSEVMAAVQHLRHLAMAAGTLKTTPQCHCVVSTKGEAITIATAASEPVCVPVYHSRVAYGSWPYPAYPPIDFPVPYGVAFLPGYDIGFYPPIDVAWYWPLWGWDSIDWGAGSIFVDRARYAVLAVGDPGFAGSAWAHDPHRWGAVDSARVGGAGAAGVAAALPGMRGAGRAAAIGGAAAAAAGLAAGRGGSHAGYPAAAVHAARAAGGGRWGAHAGRAGGHWGGHFGGHFAGRGGAHWGGHFAGGHFAAGRMRGGGHFGGGHFAMGGGHGGGHFGGGGGPHLAMGGGGGGHGGGGHGGGGGGGHGGGHGH